MATIRRAGFGTVFELEDSKVGIGTDAATHTLQALGNIRSEGVRDVGVTTLTTYQGFTNKEARFTGQIDNQSQSGSTSGEIVIDGDVTVSSATTFTSGPQNLTVTDTFTLPSGDTNSRELKPTPGSLRFNQDFATLEFYTGNNWATVNTFTEIQNSPSNRGRGVIASGYIAPARQDTIDFIEISSQGNALNFGDLNDEKAQPGPGATSSRGLFAGGMTPSATNQIEYITIPSEGNGIDFGDLTRSCNNPGGASSSTRMLAAGSNTPSGASNVIDYFEMHTLGNAIDFGDLTRSKYPAGVQSPTRAVFGGGYTPNGENNSLEFSIFASLGNTTSFGDLTQVRGNPSSGGNSTRGLYAGGWGGPASMITSIDFITIASEGNAKRFGDLTEKMSEQMGGCANSVRCTFAGGNNPGQNPLNTINFVTIASAGNAQDFGDLTLARRGPTSLSDSHGGLGGF